MHREFLVEKIEKLGIVVKVAVENSSKSLMWTSSKGYE